MANQKKSYQKPKITQVELDPEVSAAKGCKKARSVSGRGNETACNSPNNCKDLGS